MSDEKIVFFLGMGLGGIIGIGMFLPIGISLGTSEMQRECIKHDAAEYDKKTGVWHWNKQIPGEQGQ